MSGRCCGNCACCKLDVCVYRKADARKRAARRPSMKTTGQLPASGDGAAAATTGRESSAASCDDLIYTYDGSLEGLFSAVFATYANHRHPRAILDEHDLQGDIFSQAMSIPEDDGHAHRVRDGICRRLGYDEYERVKAVFLADSPERGTVIYRYIAYAMRVGRSTQDDLTHPDVAAFDKLARSVLNERHRLLEFVRFTKMRNGIFFARICPKANVVPLLMGHFAGRFNTQPFLIYDEVHHIAGVYDLTGWNLVSTDSITIPDYAPEEQSYQDMWKTFYDRICNDERYNPALRRQFMPKRLWKDIVEVNPLARSDVKRAWGLDDDPMLQAATQSTSIEVAGSPAAVRQASSAHAPLQTCSRRACSK